MKVLFFDRQDKSNPHHGSPVNDVTWLMSRIDELRDRPPSFCELEADNGFKLLLGIGEDRGCAQFSASDGSPPYLMAADETIVIGDEHMEFLTANTDTPIPMRYCVPIDVIKSIATEFFATGERSAWSMWEEI